MAPSPDHPAIAVFGHYGNQNLGDESIIAATIQNIRLRRPGARIIGMSVNPRDTAARHGVEVWPICCLDEFFGSPPSGVQEGNGSAGRELPAERDWQLRIKRIPIIGLGFRILRRLLHEARRFAKECEFIGRSYVFLRGVDLLFVAGSNQFLDNFGGPWGFPYNLFKWTILARLTGTRVAFVSVGAGPLDRPLSKLMVRLAIRMADYVSYRDSGSKDLIETHTRFAISGGVYPDLAHGLLLDELTSSAQRSPRKGGGSKPVVGVNPMPVYDKRYWFEPDDEKYDDYVSQFSGFCAYLLRNEYPVVLFSTQRADQAVIEDVVSGLDPSLRHSAVLGFEHSRDVADLMRLLDSLDIVVATRFHGTLLAFLTATPVLPVCYYRKTRELAEEMGQCRYALDLDQLTTEALIARFDKLAARYTRETGRIRCGSQSKRAALDEQFDRVMGLL